MFSVSLRPHGFGERRAPAANTGWQLRGLVERGTTNRRGAVVLDATLALRAAAPGGDGEAAGGVQVLDELAIATRLAKRTPFALVARARLVLARDRDDVAVAYRRTFTIFTRLSRYADLRVLRRYEG